MELKSIDTSYADPLRKKIQDAIKTKYPIYKVKKIKYDSFFGHILTNLKRFSITTSFYMIYFNQG